MKNKRILKLCLSTLALVPILSGASTVMAANGLAFSAGKGYGDLDMAATTIKCYTSYNTMGYNSYYATSNATYNTLSGKFTNGTKRLESDIVFLTGHAMWNSLNTLAGAGIRIGAQQGTTYVGTNTIDWSKTKLVIFLGCNSGQETSNSEVNLAYNVFKRSNWTTTSIGWRQTIFNTSAEAFMDNFNSKLESGSTISSALNYAFSKNYNNNSIKDITFYGNQNLVLKKSRSLSNINSNENNITYTNNDIEFSVEMKDLPNIITLLKQQNNSFDINDYKVNIYTISKDSQYYVIDFIYTIGDVTTNSAYSVIVNNGKVVQIADNTVNFNKEDININFNNKEEIVAKKAAASNAISKNINECITNSTNISPVTIREQTSRKYIDLNTGKRYIQVFTTYGYEDSDAITGTEYNYEI